MLKWLKAFIKRNRGGKSMRSVIDEYLADYFKSIESRLESLEGRSEETRKRVEANRRKLFREDAVPVAGDGKEQETEPDLAEIIGSLRPGEPIPVQYLHLF